MMFRREGGGSFQCVKCAIEYYLVQSVQPVAEKPVEDLSMCNLSEENCILYAEIEERKKERVKLIDVLKDCREALKANRIEFTMSMIDSVEACSDINIEDEK